MVVDIVRCSRTSDRGGDELVMTKEAGSPVVLVRRREMRIRCPATTTTATIAAATAKSEKGRGWTGSHTQSAAGLSSAVTP